MRVLIFAGSTADNGDRIQILSLLEAIKRAGRVVATAQPEKAGALA